jgi:hypothetical protein
MNRGDQEVILIVLPHQSLMRQTKHFYLVVARTAVVGRELRLVHGQIRAGRTARLVGTAKNISPTHRTSMPRAGSA